MDTHNEPVKTYTVVDTLEEMRKLTKKKGWNSYEAEPIPGEVINNAIALVKTLRYMPEVYPVATGNVQMEWDRSDGGYLEVTVLEDPDEVKVYLDATAQVRAQRRFDQGVSNMTLEEIKQAIEKRDEMDKNKKEGSLKIAPDALYIDTSNLTIEEVCAIIERQIS